jgi:hypothetical protein
VEAEKRGLEEYRYRMSTDRKYAEIFATLVEIDYVSCDVGRKCRPLERQGPEYSNHGAMNNILTAETSLLIWGLL